MNKMERIIWNNSKDSEGLARELNKALTLDGIGLTIGLLYFIWYKITTLGIPCMIFKTTGLYCPSCGVTRMIMALVKLDIVTAFQMNPFILCLLPYGAFIYIRKYVYLLWKGVPYNYEKYHKYIGICLIVGAIIFGIIRNLPSFGYLRP